MNLLSTKEALLKICKEKLASQIEALKVNLESIKESRDNETKSSVGDKYETGRAMMQLEFQKVQSQILRVKADYSELITIDLNKKTSKVEKGSLVQTNHGLYFISVALGKIKVDEQIYFCLSLKSPIGKLLQNKKVGDQIKFNTKKIVIMKIA